MMQVHEKKKKKYVPVPIKDKQNIFEYQTA